jgi:hypothetical protein
MTFRLFMEWFSGRVITPGAQERARQMNASMDEFVRLLHTNGYDSKNPNTLGEVAGLSHRPACAQDARSSQQQPADQADPDFSPGRYAG